MSNERSGSTLTSVDLFDSSKYLSYKKEAHEIKIIQSLLISQLFYKFYKRKITTMAFRLLRAPWNIRQIAQVRILDSFPFHKTH